MIIVVVSIYIYLWGLDMKKILSLGLILGLCVSFMIGCSDTESKKTDISAKKELSSRSETSNNKNSKQEILDSYDDEEDVKYDVDLLAEATDIESEMLDILEDLIVEYNETGDKVILVEECETYKEIFKDNIETIKNLEEETKTQETYELIQMLEEQAKIDYYTISDLSELKYEESNSWTEVYNEKKELFRKKLDEVTKKYNEILGIDESELKEE